MNAFEAVYRVVEQIPRGCAMSYGQVARLAGNPHWARVVGYALRCAPEGLPCHRVVHADGSTSAAFRVGGEDWQRLLLMEEGVPFLPDGRVDLANCQTCGRRAERE